MAFVDISGFTAMSERLAPEGRAGAEQVTEVMNATFERLLDVGYAYGGGLLKFGGDALLLFFEGEQHERRATRASYEMRRALRAIGRPRTTAGPVTLRMHVGIHSGEFLFVLAGSTHRELVVTGAAAATTVAMEGSAEAGEIVVSDTTAAALPAGTLGEARAGGRLLVGSPPASQALEPLPDVRDLPLEECVPVLVRDHVTAGVAEPEHRSAAVGFVRVHDVAVLEREQGPAAAATALADIVETLQAAADEHDVCFLESDIDGEGARFILVAGAPRATESDLAHLLRTLRTALDKGTRLPVSIGVNRGRVFAGEVGAPFRRTYTILGGTAALAARLMAKAERGELLAPRDVVAEAGFDTGAPRALALKGLAEPVQAVAVGAARAVAHAAPAPSMPLVGRQRELAVMTAALAPVRMGFGTMVELVGEAGVGKTRLLQEFRAQATDLVRMGARCDEYERATPYFLFRGLLRNLVGLEADGATETNTAALRAFVERVSPDLLPWIPLLALPLDVTVESTQEVDDLQPAFRRARLHGVMETLLGAILDTPTLILFEDVHWIDEASAMLLRHLGATNATRPWAICTTRRPGNEGFVAAGGTPPVAAMTILLEPLLDDEAAELVRAAAGDRLDDAAVAAVVRRAGGNPLFLQELIDTAEADEELPDTVDAVVTTRIDRLAPPDRALLRWASVLGVTFDGSVIEDVLQGDPAAAGDSDAWERLSEFVERDPYVPGGFRFRHALIRDAAYQGLAVRRRRELHQSVGETLERRAGSDVDEAAELLSLHFSLAGDAARTWRYSLAAGTRAKAKFANVEAAEFYRRALHVAKTVGVDRTEQASVWEALADVSTLAGHLGDARAALAEARRLAARADQPALMLKEGLLREEQGAYSEALRWYTRGERALDDVADETRRAQLAVELMLARAQIRFRQGRYDDALRGTRLVIEGANALGDLRTLAHAYYLSHVIHTLRGSPERHAFRGLALPIYEEIGDLVGQATVLNNLGIEAYYEGRWDEARDLYERSRTLRERTGDVINVATTTNNVGEIDSDQGRYAEAEARFREALRIADTAGQRFIAAMVRGNLGRVAVRAGRFDEADELLAGAMTALDEMGAEPFALEMQARRAELLVLRGGDPDGAVRLAEETLARLSGADVPPAVHALLERIRGVGFSHQADADRAREALRRALEIAEGAQAEYETGLTLRALARLEGRASDLDAAAIFRRLGVDEDALPPA
jgi:class 3 adenylate cyclase/tetratricopeptide (TPR) repeat protein